MQKADKAAKAGKGVPGDRPRGKAAKPTGKSRAANPKEKAGAAPDQDARRSARPTASANGKVDKPDDVVSGLIR